MPLVPENQQKTNCGNTPKPKRKQAMELNDNMTLDQAVPRQSKYLSKEDCEPPVLATIAGMGMAELEGDHGTENRTVLYFNGDLKPLVLNQTNKELLKAVTGATTVGEVKGKAIVLFNDNTIMFGGKMVGGIRIRAAQQDTPPGLTSGPELDTGSIPF
jgi:hypothetical protein